jgi:hypothetical protein
MNDRVEYAMNCEEFALVGLDSRRDDSLHDDSRRRAAQHARVCGKCASLKMSWEAAQAELSALTEGTRMSMPPARVENRLLQQFRLRHQPRLERRKIRVATWALAAAAVLVCTLSVWSWQNWRNGQRTPLTTSQNATVNSNNGAASLLADDVADDSSNFLVASNEGDFTQLPGASAQEVDDSAIVRVGMPRASLAALGLPVNEERADEWIQVDLLVASDGSPQAVRLRE